LKREESLESVPAGWELVGKPSAEQRLTLQVGLKQHNFDRLLYSLFNVSDPAHEQYGQHLSKSYGRLQHPFKSTLTDVQ
jgi:tripeptidyl-peptidase-1